jgi:hypothetical protein
MLKVRGKVKVEMMTENHLKKDLEVELIFLIYQLILVEKMELPLSS